MQFRRLSLVHRCQELVAVGEVLVDEGPADPGTLGHRLHRHLVHPLRPDQRHGGVEQGITARGALQAPSRDCCPVGRRANPCAGGAHGVSVSQLVTLCHRWRRAGEDDGAGGDDDLRGGAQRPRRRQPRDGARRLPRRLRRPGVQGPAARRDERSPRHRAHRCRCQVRGAAFGHGSGEAGRGASAAGQGVVRHGRLRPGGAEPGAGPPRRRGAARVRHLRHGEVRRQGRGSSLRGELGSEQGDGQLLLAGQALVPRGVRAAGRPGSRHRLWPSKRSRPAAPR